LNLYVLCMQPNEPTKNNVTAWESLLKKLRGDVEEASATAAAAAATALPPTVAVYLVGGPSVSPAFVAMGRAISGAVVNSGGVMCELIETGDRRCDMSAIGAAILAYTESIGGPFQSFRIAVPSSVSIGMTTTDYGLVLSSADEVALFDSAYSSRDKADRAQELLTRLRLDEDKLRFDASGISEIRDDPHVVLDILHVLPRGSIKYPSGPPNRYVNGALSHTKAVTERDRLIVDIDLYEGNGYNKARAELCGHITVKADDKVLE
jgi:hypothetical protein